MRRVMKEVSVWTDKKEDLICIEQPTDDPGNESDSQVFLVPEQIPTLIEWLQQAMTDLQSN